MPLDTGIASSPREHPQSLLELPGAGSSGRPCAPTKVERAQAKRSKKGRTSRIRSEARDSFMTYPFTPKPLKHETRQHTPKRQSGGVSRANEMETMKNSVKYYVNAADKVEKELM